MVLYPVKRSFASLTMRALFLCPCLFPSITKTLKRFQSLQKFPRRSIHDYRKGRNLSNVVSMQCLRRRPPQKFRSHDLLTFLSTPHRGLRNPFTPIHHHLKPTVPQHGRRYFLSQVPAVLVPPVIFLGLGIGLWTWKCCMMVLFQNKIIYMPGLPPNARRERISDYASHTVGVNWREVNIKSGDGTDISLCVAATKSRGDMKDERLVYVLYFQGNASSIPPRLPFLSPIVGSLEAQASGGTRYVFICVSYRGYWTSQGRPSEDGITQDALAALRWVSSQLPEDLSSLTPRASVPVVVWGQSIGAGVASNLVANHLSLCASSKSTVELEVRALVLETPFTNVRDMLVTLYPQKWLPYRYLWPFLRNHLDSLAALTRIAENDNSKPKIFILEAGKDELVPAVHGEMLEARCKEVGLEVEKHTVKGALHTEITALPDGRRIIVEALKEGSS